MQTAREQAAKRARITSAATTTLPSLPPSGTSSYPGFVLAADATELPETSEAPLWARLQEGGSGGEDDADGDSDGERAAEDAAYLAGLAARAAEAERASDVAVAGFRSARAAIVGGRAAAAGAFAPERAMNALASNSKSTTNTEPSNKQRGLLVVRRKRPAPESPEAPGRPAAEEAPPEPSLEFTPKEQLVSGYSDLGSSDSE